MNHPPIPVEIVDRYPTRSKGRGKVYRARFWCPTCKKSFTRAEAPLRGRKLTCDGSGELIVGDLLR